jgi:hypothetical protein
MVKYRRNRIAGGEFFFDARDAAGALNFGERR